MNREDGAKFFSKNMIISLVFGVMSGLPLALVFGTLSLWLKDCGIAYKTIGAFSLIRLPYSFKWLWAPLVERISLVGLGRLGKRRSWAILAELGLLFSIVLMSCFEPKDNIWMIVLAALLISFFSATQDIVLDAFRVELFSLSSKDEVNGATIYVLGYRIGSVISGAGAIGLASLLSWNEVYRIIAFILVLGILAVLWADEPKVCEEKVIEKDKNIFMSYLVEPFVGFTQIKYWKVALGLVFLYRLSDAYLGPMAYPFYMDLGFSKVEIAYISKIYGMIATIIGGVLGGIIVNKIGIFKALLVFALLQGGTNLLYIPIYYLGHSVYGLMAVISLENLVSGMATTVIIAFMSLLCDKRHTATQYALLSSLPGFARDVIASTSGVVLEASSWPMFFVVSAVFSLPAVVCSLYLFYKKPDYLLKT